MPSQPDNVGKPRNIVPLISPQEVSAFSAAPTAHLTYHGGPVLTSVRVQTLFWGTAWQRPPQSALIVQLGKFFDFILQSSLIDVLEQYGSISHGEYLSAVKLTTPSLESTISDAQVQQALQGWIESQAVTQPNSNTLYFIYLPPGVVSTSGGESSCKAYCGYHNHINSQIFYAVEPYLNCAGCEFGRGIFDSLTKVSSHELCEAITDPALNAWFDSNTGDEIGDICNGSVATLGGFVVQGEWSNSQNACVVKPRAPS